ncbi:hypothetical protein Dshi_0078 [Dinoroseobacter shibae DFL 12 = DSM 16493]|uniref:Uncharacterized protein n=1 Tax=Dinoroseobacter shibae (strain DSM 16493 / NCIMB 14021 / DFL 12) TaxID=398580 RepID=A8LK01_DINSH|nr:hypothetical protein [Dinoroseobacter shibae]ABV91827.1 hypothetical protein Dshi_0078 [Dinoroseobacter shibae DFL 12 = DSM 16493]URF46806.1 hypothetical protein M8008_00395 [Dinoroseobacter shibae]URF51117.1 hypothetical protein M8007_00395 [Dinoroseobacter shibae]
MSLSAFARTSRQGPAATARLLLDGALAPAVRCPDDHGWEAIRVLETQINRHRKPLARSLRHADGQLTTEALAASYGLRYVTITRLVELTLLPPADRHKVDGRRMEGYPVAAVEQLFAHHRTLSDLAAAHGCSPHLMAPLLARLGVRPLIAEKGHTRLYAIADLPPAIRLAEEVAKAQARTARFKTPQKGALSQE